MYLTCYHVLVVNYEEQEARHLLKQAYQLLQTQADGIPDTVPRYSFLHNVPAHYQIVKLYQAD